ELVADDAALEGVGERSTELERAVIEGGSQIWRDGGGEGADRRGEPAAAGARLEDGERTWPAQELPHLPELTGDQRTKYGMGGQAGVVVAGGADGRAAAAVVAQPGMVKREAHVGREGQ